MNDGETIYLKKNSILLLAGETENDLYIIEKGKVLAFVQNGSQVTPLAYLHEGEYIGELSYFDKMPRSASIVTVEDTVFKKIKASQINEYFPAWLKTVAMQMCKKIRLENEIIRTKGLRKKQVDSILPLTIEEQTFYYKLTEKYKMRDSL